MNYHCHIWAGGTQSALSSLDRVQYLLRRHVVGDFSSTLYTLSSWRNFTNSSLFSWQISFIHCFDPVQTLRVRTQNDNSTKLKHLHFPRVLNARKCSPLRTFVPEWSFCETYKSLHDQLIITILIFSKVNCYLFSLFAYYSFPTIFPFIHIKHRLRK